MSWIYLLLAGVFEIGWPLGLKLSQSPEAGTGKSAGWIFFSIICMGVSGFFLWLAQRDIPIGTAYAVWTGIGAIGAFIIGLFFFGDHASMWRIISATFLVIGIVGLKLAH